MLAQREGHVVVDVLVGEQRTELVQHAHAAAHRVEAVAVERADILAVEQHLALDGLVLAADQAQQGGLATARGPDQHRDLAARHMQVDVLEHEAAIPIPEGEVADFNQVL